MRKDSLIGWSLTAIVVVVVVAWYWKEEQFLSVPRLSQDEVAGIARQMAVENRVKLEDYQPPEANFWDFHNGKTGRWIVNFYRKGPRDFTKLETNYMFEVVVDDKTGRAAMLTNGAYKNPFAAP
jgi:hypothetical protein